MGSALEYLTLTELAQARQRGAVSSVEIVKDLLDRISTFEGKLHAFRLMLEKDALAAAEAADAEKRPRNGPVAALQGLPYALKDLFDVKGLPTTAGCNLLAWHIAAENSAAAERLARAGMILLGKTNLVQFARGSIGTNSNQGTPWNPWSRSAYAPGGSSSGSAVAVAAGLVPAALGTDTGGSVRGPAALCGITGLKATVGRISRAGIYKLSTTLDSVGTLTRSVADAALLLTALAGADRRDHDTVGAPAMDVLKRLGDGVKGHRLAYAESMFRDTDPEIAAAVRAAGVVLSDCGAILDSTPFDEARHMPKINAHGIVSSVEGNYLNKDLLASNSPDLDPNVVNSFAREAHATAFEYYGSLRLIAKERCKAIASMGDFDALLVPTTTLPALPLATVCQSPETYAHFDSEYALNARVTNVLGLCALSVPCGFTSGGMPIGLQIIGRPFDEATILRVGQAFQTATSWHTRRPTFIV